MYHLNSLGVLGLIMVHREVSARKSYSFLRPVNESRVTSQLSINSAAAGLDCRLKQWILREQVIIFVQVHTHTCTWNNNGQHGC